MPCDARGDIAAIKEIGSKTALAMTIGGQAFPLVPLICTNCGNTHLLNLFVLGFSREDQKQMSYFVPENVPEKSD